MLRGKWWEIYQDPQLNQLEERIAANNQTLRQALETYLAARDQVSAARAGFFPTLSAGPSASRENISANGPSFSAGKPTTYSDFVLTGQASWEPDFWGRIRRTVEAARSNAQASAAERPTSTSAFMPRWPPTTSNCAAWTPRSSCWTPPSPTWNASST